MDVITTTLEKIDANTVRITKAWSDVTDIPTANLVAQAEGIKTQMSVLDTNYQTQRADWQAQLDSVLAQVDRANTLNIGESSVIQ